MTAKKHSDADRNFDPETPIAPAKPGPMDVVVDAQAEFLKGNEPGRIPNPGSGAAGLQIDNNDWDDDGVPYDQDTAPERQAGFYRRQIESFVRRAGISAIEAARLILIRDGDILYRLGPPDVESNASILAKELLTLDEARSTKIDGTIHPLSEWLQRARDRCIEYIPGLDWAVEHWSPPSIGRAKDSPTLNQAEPQPEPEPQPGPQPERRDAASREIEAIVRQMEMKDEPITAGSVMFKLRERASDPAYKRRTCFYEAPDIGTDVKWRRDDGQQEVLNRYALKQRLRRMKIKRVR